MVQIKKMSDMTTDTCSDYGGVIYCHVVAVQSVGLHCQPGTELITHNVCSLFI